MIRQPTGRFALGMVPVGIVLVTAELVLLAGRESFVDPISFMGAVTASLIGGVFPMLMVVASRRKGDFAISGVWRAVGHSLTAVVAGAIFLTGLLLHGLVIWDIPYQQAAALFGAVATIAAIVAALRQGAYRHRTVAEIREDPTVDAPAAVNVVAAGEAVGAVVRWPESFSSSAAGFRSVEIDLPVVASDDLRTWAYRLDPEGVSRDLPVSVEIDQSGTSRHVDLRATDSHCTVPSTGAPAHIRVRRADATGTDRLTDVVAVAAHAPSNA